MIDQPLHSSPNSALDDILSELENQLGSSSGNKSSQPLSSSPQKSSSNDFPSLKKPILTVSALLLLLIGTGVAMFMANRAQDVRQQAAEEGGTASIQIKPGSSGIQSGSQSSLDLVANAGTNVEIVGIQFVADISGDIPPDIQFVPQTIPNLNLVVNTLEDTSGGKKLTVAYLTNPPASYPATNSDIKAGTLKFTLQTGDSVTFNFDNTLTKIVRKSDSVDILQPIEPFIFSIADATIAPTSTSVPSNTPTSVPTSTPGQGGVTNTPTNTPIPSVPSCNPSTIQPEAGSAPLLVTLIGGGSASSSGLVGYQWDFEDDGNWDTPESSLTLEPIQHTYLLPGVYYPKYRILDENGLWSEICDYNYSIIVGDSTSPTQVPISSATPTIPVGDICLAASVINPNRSNGESTRIGDTINILCGEVATAEKYEFRIINPTGLVDTLEPISSGARQSEPYQITTSGRYYMQCRICTSNLASSCSEWENYQ